MNKIKLPFLNSKSFAESAKRLLHHLSPSPQKIGAPPGTLTYTGRETAETKINFSQYNNSEITSQTIDTIENLTDLLSKKHVNWIDVTGFKNIDLISQIGTLFNIDQLTMEDMLNVSQLPKIEERDEYLYITLKLVELKAEENSFDFIHYSLIITENALITFSEKPSILLSSIEDRLKNNLSKLRNSTIAYLSYRIIDTIVDHYYTTLDWFTNILSNLEMELVENPSRKHINTILTFKKQWLVLRKAYYPLKESIRKMLNVEPRLIKAAGKHYIVDLNDHLQSIGETMEILRESLNSLMDLYNSTVSNKMNEVMQVLTIVSTIFIPLTFIAGIYGMNFEYMPELSWQNGYFYALGVMAVIGIIMFIYMKRKRWL